MSSPTTLLNKLPRKQYLVQNVIEIILDNKNLRNFIRVYMCFLSKKIRKSIPRHDNNLILLMTHGMQTTTLIYLYLLYVCTKHYIDLPNHAQYLWTLACMKVGNILSILISNKYAVAGSTSIKTHSNYPFPHLSSFDVLINYMLIAKTIYVWTHATIW